MNIVILGCRDRNNKIIDYLSRNNNITQFNVAPSLGYLKKHNTNLILSSGYHLKIEDEIIENYEGRVINIHASRLPYGRGIGTILISLLFPCPIGVSIHLIDKKFDNGPILDVKDVSIDDFIYSTQRYLHAKLVDESQKLLIKN